jgi:hypothetical protein
MTERPEVREAPGVRGFSASSNRTRVSSLAARACPLGLAAAGLALVGCGGGMPLLHPAQTLDVGDVRAMAGFSSNIAVGNLSTAVRNAANDAASQSGTAAPPAPHDITYAEGALVAASVGTGLAPVVGARVGIGANSEAGVAYTGRSARVDIRHAFELSETWALSVGAGGSAALYGREDSDTLPNVDLNRLHGWGADVPVLVGYQSDGDLYMLWAGVRAGWEHVDIDDVTSEPGSGQLGPTPIALAATRFWGGGLFGAAVGFRHVHVAMEFDASFASITGDFNGAHAHVAGVSLNPGTALWWQF